MATQNWVEKARLPNWFCLQIEIFREQQKKNKKEKTDQFESLRRSSVEFD